VFDIPFIWRHDEPIKPSGIRLLKEGFLLKEILLDDLVEPFDTPKKGLGEG